MFVIVITCLTPETLKMLSFILVQVRDLMAHYWQPHIIRFFGGFVQCATSRGKSPRLSIAQPLIHLLNYFITWLYWSHLSSLVS